jgi:uncharacterized protein (TIGR03663 family)
MDHVVPRSRGARWLVFLIVALIGLTVRLPRLSARPMHTDEAVNAYIVGELLAGEKFNYDPQDRHGPALAAVALPLARLQGARSFPNLTESELRLTSVVAGTVTILLFGVAADLFGFMPCLIAAILCAVAPLPVYYDRYFIHEPLFCAATFGLILSGGYALKSGSIRYAALAGACAAWMFACKETAVLHFLALAAAVLVFAVWDQRGHAFFRRLGVRPLIAAAGTALALIVLLFTWFGTNWKGLESLLRMGPDVLARAAGQGHEKPFWYYARLLIGGWSGGLLCLLACLGLVIALRRRDRSAYRCLAYYAFSLAILYSVIPYKTPWLALNLWLPLVVFAARAVESLGRWCAMNMSRSLEIAVLGSFAVLIGLLIAHDTRQRVFLQPAEETNPYAYAHTTDDILSLPAEIRDVARQTGIVTPRIAVIAADPWPLPWYLRQFGQVGFYQPGQRVPDADFYITSTEASDQYTDRLRKFRPEFFGVRPGVLILLWSAEPQ